MDKYKTLIITLCIILILLGLVYLAYLIDTKKITTYADPEDKVSASELNKLPSPDESIISKIYSAIIKPFVRK